ncbi:uncharacterized protein [Argopecten irradians]|uniref:uncharacterized protein n=1 Tax=Argopecten irradians TaxID=31199 RepID=UPI003713A576
MSAQACSENKFIILFFPQHSPSLVSEMRFLVQHIAFVISSFLQIHAQGLCHGVDFKNTIIEQSVMENIRPYVVDLMETQYQQTLKECRVVCNSNNDTHLKQKIKQQASVTRQQQGNDSILGKTKMTNSEHILLEDFPMHMDETTLNPRAFLSRNRKSLFNSGNPWGNLTNEFPFNWPIEGSNTLQKYYGAKGTLPLKYPNTICFEIDAYYSIYFNLTGRNLLFEIGIGRSDVVDNAHYIGWEPDFTWSFVVSRDDVTGQVRSACQSRQRNHGSFPNLSDSTTGSQHSMSIGIRVNMADGIMTVVDRSTFSVLCNLTDVDVTQDLWPMFGVYAKSSTDVVVTLRHSFLMSSRTWIDL